MTRLAVSRINLILQSPKTVLLISLLLITSFAAACSGANQKSASDSSTASSTSSSSAPATSGAFEGAITAKMFAGDQPMEIKYAIKGTRTRVETQLSQGGTQTGVMLMDLSSSTQTMMMPQTKTYMTMNWGDVADTMMKDVPDETFKATTTGKTETVAGFTCQHWLVGDKQDTDICLAQGLGYFGGGGQSGGVFDKLKNLALGDKMKAQLAANPEFAKFVEGGAFPLKMAQIENGQSKTIMEVTNVERKSLDDSLFTVPADYKKMEIPGMPGIPTGKR
ncbi:MAG: DUF4412 domain-containing protein [Blastocatellales bacterium]